SQWNRTCRLHPFRLGPVRAFYGPPMTEGVNRCGRSARLNGRYSQRSHSRTRASSSLRRSSDHALLRAERSNAFISALPTEWNSDSAPHRQLSWDLNLTVASLYTVPRPISILQNSHVDEPRPTLFQPRDAGSRVAFRMVVFRCASAMVR